MWKWPTGHSEEILNSIPLQKKSILTCWYMRINLTVIGERTVLHWFNAYPRGSLTPQATIASYCTLRRRRILDPISTPVLGVQDIDVCSPWGGSVSTRGRGHGWLEPGVSANPQRGRSLALSRRNDTACKSPLMPGSQTFHRKPHYSGRIPVLFCNISTSCWGE